MTGEPPKKSGMVERGGGTARQIGGGLDGKVFTGKTNASACTGGR